MSQENVQTIRSIYEAFAMGNIPAVLALMDQGIEWREAENYIYADRNPYVGPQAVLEGVFMRLGSDWEGSPSSRRNGSTPAITWWCSAFTSGRTRRPAETCGLSSPTFGA